MEPITIEPIDSFSSLPDVSEFSTAALAASGGEVFSKTLAPGTVPKCSALPFIITAVGGFIIGYMTSKMFDWMNPEPGPNKVPSRHIHDHHHFHHQGSPSHETATSKFTG